MGCGGSKLEDLPAVVLCKERCLFVEEAVRLRLLLAESHLSYAHSLRTIGNSFHFLLLEASNLSTPTLTLPPEGKGDAHNSTGKHVTFHSHSNSGSHLHLPSDSDSDSDISHFHLYDNGESLQQHENQRTNSTFFHMNYMKSGRPVSSIVYEQKPVSSESVFYFGEEPVANTYAESYMYPYHGYSTYSSDPSGGYYGYTATAPHSGIATSSSTTKPPPSPPRASPWDFFNVFDNANNRYYGGYGSKSTPRSSNAREEEEGLPDLEDVDEINHYRDRKNGHVVRNEAAKESNEISHSSGVSSLEGDEDETHSSLNDHIASDVSTDEESREGGNGEVPVEYEVRVMDKKVVGSGTNEESHNTRRRGPLDVSQVVSEIKSQFEKASASAGDVLHLLESTSQPLHTRRSVVNKKKHKSKSRPSVSGENSLQEGLEIDEELDAKAKNLSSTLHKLFLWEKKLLNEVKAEEKLRVSHEKKWKRLKRLDLKGAEVQKVDSTRAMIRTLSWKMRMAVQVVDKISIEINKIRDEELWPHLHELIQRQTKMWKNMLECHQNQRGVIQEAVNLGSLGKSVQASEAYVEAVKELVKWTSTFSEWVAAQKGYVKALNNWLRSCILYEPEETADGVVPFSPGRMGAPPVFVLCHQWAQAMDRISEKEVLEAMCTFTVGVLRLRYSKVEDSLVRVVTNKDLERKARDSLRDDMKVSSEITSLEKQIVRVAINGNVVSFNEENGEPNLQFSMVSLFEAMERFMSDSHSVYEELVLRSGQLR